MMRSNFALAKSAFIPRIFHAISPSGVVGRILPVINGRNTHKVRINAEFGSRSLNRVATGFDFSLWQFSKISNARRASKSPQIYIYVYIP